jgi:glycosyltransferase involved in cell wall biosynthesis
MTLRVLVVSHPATVALNQLPYIALLDQGIDVQLVVPDRWRHELGGGAVPPEVDERLAGRVHRARIARAGSIQGHVYLAPPGRWLRRLRPDAVIVEEEHFSVPAAQWVGAARRRRIPVAVQAYENLDRPLPAIARALRRRTLRAADGVLARTPTAGERAAQWGAGGVIHLVPPAVRVPDAIELTPPSERPRPFTAGYAGRLIEAKGLRDLVAAVAALGDGSRLLAVGDGPLRPELEAHPLVDVRTGIAHADMPASYAAMDVLVLPSRTTATWAEQLGRVLLEAMAAGRSVIGSSSGEIPWVLSVARGGTTFPEGDVTALAHRLAELRDDPALGTARAAQGRRDVEERFSPEASATALRELVELMRRRSGRPAAQ